MDTFLNGRALIVVGDITQQRVDAVVNAANATLRGGGGVDGAIHAAAGPELLAECEALRRTRFPEGLPTGDAVATGAGRLRARYVIHTVGPIKGMHGEHDPLLLAACYRRSLAVAASLHCRTVALPSISTGAYGYPKDQAAAVASAAVGDFLERDRTIEEVRLVFFSPADARVFVTHQRF